MVQMTILSCFFTETTPPTPEIVQKHQTHSPANDDGKYFPHIHSLPIWNMFSWIDNYTTVEDEGVILEEDSEDEEGYMFAGQGN